MLKFDWCRAHKREISAMALLVLVLFMAQWRSQRQDAGRYIEEGGRITGIQRQNPEKEESFPLLLEMETEGETQIYEVTITLQGEVSDADSTDGLSQEASEGFVKGEAYGELQEKVNQLIEGLETKKGKEILLPFQLSDGTPISWEIERNRRWMLLLLLPPGMMYFLYRSEKERESRERKNLEQTVRKSLPAFNDQLLLLLNCGLIFHDAFSRIGGNYSKRKEKNAFCRMLEEVICETEEGGQSVTTSLRRKAQEAGIREFTRIVNIICDNQHRGVGLSDKLESESRLLWEERKLMAMQKGKEVETKLTLPLAVLLVVLIMITGVPALMNM